ncbi:MerR family transcriptional regulator [Paramicrobacterium chengjingii]|uniref:MerR family transcriptional regulator n=1 Tax=Paramicrobacterium chengjingii TaxID=2769067 RepID=A0ABX6YG55_9MICO|nr:MerR family transcriptional regulator [Microbacterium chengjingii]QPZ37778.1 MerR family transcriptional regulator [Microbacterium chengjingii]
MDELTAGEFRHRTRLSAKMLRLYADADLLTPARIDPFNQYRYYDESQIPLARLIVLLRGLKMPLADIGRLLEAHDDQRPGIVDAYWQRVESEHATTRALANYVISQFDPERTPTMSVHTRTVNETTYVTEKKTVRPEQIPSFIEESGHRLFTVASRFGGPAGALTTIYNQEVNDESSGEIENAVPVAGAISESDVSAPVSVLTEPAGEHAYTRISKAQVRFPQILQAYDEVFAWLEKQSLTPTGRPREVYFADWAEIGPDDPACDIAVPFTR